MSLLIFNKLKDINISYTNNTNIYNNINSSNILDIGNIIHSHTKYLLNGYNLTNGDIFIWWVRLYEYINNIIYNIYNSNTDINNSNINSNINSNTDIIKEYKDILMNLYNNIIIYGENDISDIIYRILLIL
ncbi:DNA polymerase III [Ecytonucleospora hepatopenaei]|uniref:DNA polymerase III n=1 Tax=Ecytonucleospora hepatopenaei TaxID=646526 RepID=A0A1W0E7G1_9MICR|nr:DNA polymerase III [Ecytonucleospora hepatopenaei]